MVYVLWSHIHGVCVMMQAGFTLPHSLVPGAEEERLVHTDVLPVN